MKKLFAALLVVLMALTLVGCSSSTNASSSNESENTTIVIGGSGPTSGDYKAYGQAVQHGAEIAVAEINAAEGTEFFKLLFEDDQADPEIAVNALNAMMDGGLQVSLLTTTSGACAAVAPVVQDADMFGITPSGSVADIPTVGENIFQMCFTDPGQGTAAADYINDNFPGATVGIIYQAGSEYSQGIHDTFVAEAKVVGLNIAADEAFNSGDASYADQIGAMSAAGCDVVLLPIYYTEAAGILTQAGDYKPVWFGVDGMDGILTDVVNFNTELAEGVYLLTPFSAVSEDPKVVNFVKQFNDQYGETPNQFAADAYDCVYAIYEACKAKGLDGTMSVSELSAALKEWFTTETFNGTTGLGVTWAVSGEVSKTPAAVVIENGAYASAK